MAKRYDAGDWKLPSWWTSYPPVRSGKVSHADQIKFYAGAFVHEVLGHTGGISTLPSQPKSQS